MTVEVINSRVYSNPYQQLLYSAISSRYEIVQGSLSDGIARQLATMRGLYHVHWEESLFAKCKTVAAAVKLRRDYTAKLKRYVAAGGKIVWTVHNVKPHEARFVQTFFSLRKDLAALSHRILVHNHATISVLQKQTGLDDLSKVTVLPHPSYLNVYEPADRTQHLLGLAPTLPRTLLHFGMVRAYKGIPALVKNLTPEFMAEHQLCLRICGQPHRADSFLDNLFEQTRGRPEIQYSLESVPVNAVADLLRAHAGLIIPYHNVLTSGVAVLSLTLGILTVAADTPAMRELYPESSHQLLFNPRSSTDLRRAVLALVGMSAELRQQISRDYFERALEIQPKAISLKLGLIYDQVLGSSLFSQNQNSTMLDLAMLRSRIPSMLQLMSESESMATRTSKASVTASINQQLALDLVKATLLSNVRTSIPDEVILKNVKTANKLIVERARLDGAYAVRLYKNILSRLETPAPESSMSEKDLPTTNGDN